MWKPEDGDPPDSNSILDAEKLSKEPHLSSGTARSPVELSRLESVATQPEVVPESPGLTY